MRIVVNIPTESYKELITELEQIKPRDRAERIRILAMFGLDHLHKNSPHTALSTPDLGSTRLASTDKKSVLQNKLIDSLGQ